MAAKHSDNLGCQQGGDGILIDAVDGALGHRIPAVESPANRQDFPVVKCLALHDFLCKYFQGTAAYTIKFNDTTCSKYSIAYAPKWRHIASSRAFGDAYLCFNKFPMNELVRAS